MPDIHRSHDMASGQNNFDNDGARPVLYSQVVLSLFKLSQPTTQLSSKKDSAIQGGICMDHLHSHKAMETSITAVWTAP